MSDSWGRRNPYIELDVEALTRLLQPAFPGAAVTDAQLLNGGHVNTNYRVAISGRECPYVVRLHTRGADMAVKEREAMRLAAARVPVPEVVWAGDADLPDPLPLTVLRWVPGTPLHEVLESVGPEEAAQCAAAAGETLARVGSFTFREAGFFGPGLSIAEPWGRTAQSTRRIIELFLRKPLTEQRLGEALARRVWTFAQRYCHRLNGLRDTSCLVHADYHGGNLLMHRADSWRVAAVIDWEFAFSGPPLFDVGIFLRRTARRFPATEQPFIRAFAAAGGEFPEDGVLLARTLDLMNLLQFLSREECADSLRDFALSALENTLQSIGRR